MPLVTGPVSDPFFSPDGQWVGFFSIADRKLKKVPVAGGSAVPICDIDSSYPRGASWGDDDYIVFNPYAEAWTHTAARAICRWQAGTRFDIERG